MSSAVVSPTETKPESESPTSSASAANVSSSETKGAAETKSNNSTAPRCQKCQSLRARAQCTQRRCVKCCDDDTCQVHSRSKEQRNWKEQALAGTTDTQILAKKLRYRRLPPGLFRESQFLFSGDTIVLWDLRAYCRNPKWREEAVRKSRRRGVGVAAGEAPRRVLQNSKKRFRRIMQELYEKNLST